MSDAGRDALVEGATSDAPSGADSPPPGDDSSPGDDSATGDDSSTGDDASDTGAPDTGGNDSGPLAPKPTQGEVLVSEVMFDPSGTEPDTEWFELHNVAGGARTLTGLTIADGSGHSETVKGSVVVAAGAYVVFVNAKMSASPTVPSSSVAYAYSTLTLANGTTGAVSIADGATTIGQSPYGPWGDAVNGASIQLKTQTYAGESQSSAWCISSNAWASGSDKGTPGAASDCP
jgi:hypothetical protein